jgi:hypothetical protein
MVATRCLFCAFFLFSGLCGMLRAQPAGALRWNFARAGRGRPDGGMNAPYRVLIL